LRQQGIPVRIEHNQCILPDESLENLGPHKNNLQDKLPRSPYVYI
jgi:hypothetical protein